MRCDPELLRSFISDLEKANIDYRIVGGVAKRAYTGESISNTRDVDVILRRSTTATEICQNLGVRGLRTDSYLSNIVFLGAERTYLKVLGETFPVDQKLFEPKKLVADGIEFTTVDPMTLLHLFCGFGAIRKKDWKNATDLARALKENVKSEFAESQFVPWHKKTKEIYRKKSFSLGLRFMKVRVRGLIPEDAIDKLKPVSAFLNKGMFFVENSFYKLMNEKRNKHKVTTELPRQVSIS